MQSLLVWEWIAVEATSAMVHRRCGAPPMGVVGLMVGEGNSGIMAVVEAMVVIVYGRVRLQSLKSQQQLLQQQRTLADQKSLRETDKDTVGAKPEL
jgi:hypothetical protein